MACKGKGDSGGNGGIRISTNGYWCWNLFETDPNTRQCSLATLGNVLLPEAREELPRNQLILLGHVGLRFAPYVVTQFALLRLIDLCPKEIQRFVFFVSRGSLIAIGKINTKWDLWVISI